MMTPPAPDEARLQPDAAAATADSHKQRSQKPVVLLAWEYGRNFGHVSRLLAVARLLEAQGARLEWAVPAAYARSSHILDAGYTPFSAPSMKVGRPAPASPANSFADILVSFGFADPEVLTEAVERWINLIEQLQPQSIVLDYAPAAQLAACLMGVPAFQVTNGFDAPPGDCPVFNIAMRGPYLDRINAQQVAAVDVAIQSASNRLREKHHTLPLAHATLHSMLQYPVKVLDVIPELDIYAPRDKQAVYVGPLVGLSHETGCPWSGIDMTSSGKRIFAYLRQGVGMQALIRGLASSAHAVLCVCPDAPDSWLQVSNASVRVQREPVNWDLAIEKADVVVNYGALTSVCRTLLAGKPQLMAPGDVEKHLASRRMAELGAGLIWHASNKVSFESLLSELFERKNLYGSAALNIARRYPELRFQESTQYFASSVMSKNL